MEMCLKWIVLLCAVYTAVSDDDITLKKLIFKSIEEKSDQTTISVIFQAGTPITVQDHNLIFTDVTVDPPNIIDIHNAEQPQDFETDQKINFVMENDDWNKLSVDREIIISLYSHIANQNTIEGHTSINMVTAGIENPVIAPLVKPTILREADTEKSDIRITEDVALGFHISGGAIDIESNCEDGSSTPCYYLQEDVIAADTQFSVCKNIEVDSHPPLLLCSDPVEHIEISPTGFSGHEITVNYPMANKAIQIKANDDESNPKYEMVLSNSNYQKICEGEPARAGQKTYKCTPTEGGDFEILLVGVDGDNGNVVSYSKHSLKDLQISAEALSPTSNIIEVGVKNVVPNLFQMSLVTNSYQKNPTYEVVQVDCHEIIDGSPCRGYFVGLDDDGKYQVTVNPMKDENSVNTTISYISEEVTIHAVRKNKDYNTIPIESVDTRVQGSSIEMDVCFKYIANSSSVDMQYEFLAINSVGKWKKEIDIEMKDESHACFNNIKLSLVDYGKNSKYIVILRDRTDWKPVASGEVTVNIPAVKAIKPDIGNGSNGSSSTLTIVGAAFAGIACLMALVAAAVMFVMKAYKNKDGLQYPLHRSNFEDSNIIHGLENPIPTM